MQFIEESTFVEFELERAGFKLKLVKPGAYREVPLAHADGAARPPPVVPTPASSPAGPGPSGAPEEAEILHAIHSPIVGTFYRAPSPDIPSFVEIGDRVKSGQILCIVEAMKLMNEIESEAEGEILEILVANGQPVEYGETLFKIRPIG